MRITLIVIALLLTSCGVARLPSFTPHKIEIRQGNLVTPEMRGKLKLGMSRAQVRAVLGTPLVNDALHANRWDYVYRLEQDGKLTGQQRMTVYFDGDVLARIDDGTMPAQPASAEAAAPAAVTPAAAEIVPAPLAEPIAVPVAKPSVNMPGMAPAAVEKVVEDVVLGWAAAWSARDVKKYLAHYSPDFKPANGSSRTAWAAQRRARITEEKEISVELSDIKVSMQGEDRASVTFKQSYRTDINEYVMRKTLQLEKVGDAWLIVSEQAAKK